MNELLHAPGTLSLTDGPRTLVVTQALPIYFIASLPAPGTLNTSGPMLRMSTGAINLVQLGFFLTLQPLTIEIAELLNGGSATPPILDRLVRLLNEVRQGSLRRP